MISISYNIVQFLNLPSGYASLYSGNIRSERLGNDSHSGKSDSGEAAAKELWTRFVRTLSARDQHELDWIEKWTFRALIYGVQEHRDHDHTVLIPFTLAKAESLALFTDFSWYLLSNDESKAIEMLNVCRSNFHLAVLPSGFKVTDVVVEFNRTPAVNSTLLDKNIRLVDDLAMRKRFRRRSLGHLSSSPHIVDEAGYREAKPDQGRNLSSQHLYPTAEDSDADEELPSITVTKEPSHRFGLVKGPALEYTAEPISEVSYPTAPDNQVQVDLQTTLRGPPTDDTIIPRIENCPSTSTKSSRGTLRKGNCLGKKRKSSKSNKLFMDYSLDTDMHVQSDAGGGNLPPSKRKIACNADSETESPRKRRGLVPGVNGGLDTTFGCEPSTMQLSRGVTATASASESNDINTSADGSPITTTSNADVPPSTANADAQEHESSPLHAWDGKKAFLKMSNSLCVVQHLRIPLAQRRESRGAAAKAQGMIQAQYAPHPVLDNNGAASSAHNAKQKKTKKELRGQARKRTVVDKVTQEKYHEEHTVVLDTSISTARMKMSKKSKVQEEEHIPVDSACCGESSSFTAEMAESRPGCIDTDKDANARPKKRGRPPGPKKKDVGNKSQGNGGGKGKGKGKKKNKEIEMPTTVSATEGLHSIVNESNSPTCASSPTAVVSSSSRTAFSSPSPTKAPLTRGNSSTEVSPYAESSLESGFTRNENENDDHDRLEKKSRTGLPESNSRSSLSSDNVDGFRGLILSSQGEHPDGGAKQGQDSMDVSQLNHVMPQSDDETLNDCSYKEISSYYSSRECTQSSQTSRTPWSVPHDETNYSNNSRPPGINDTHFWSAVSPIPRMNFPPLQGDPLCSDTRVHKPPLPNPPPVWAQSRQELCESLSYFRAYQGGVYTHKQRAEGYLLDGYPARYDIWHSDGRYIISHGGGHSALDRLTGRVSLVEDQVADSGSCAALISSWKAAHAIVLLAGNGYRLFPYSLDNMNYVVLGYYHIVHAWEEPEPSSVNSRGYCVRWKFLFRWIEAQGSPWWFKENDNKFKSMDTPILTSVCQVCGEHSFSIFGYGWVCTQSRCRAFFQLLDKTNVTTEGYNPTFLAPREDPPAVRGLKLEIRPKPPVQPVIHSNTEQPQIATSRHFWKGFWCEECGKLSCREFWTCWKCSNCNHTLAIKAVIQTPPKVNNVKSGRFVSQEAGITEATSRLGNGADPYECHTFTLPFNRGKIHLIKASGQSLQVADRIFRQYQLDASNDESFFRRYSMKTVSENSNHTHKLKGRMLSHYFSQNSGEPYAYVGGTNNTVKLDKYKSVIKALEYIRSRATLALNYNPDFNEVLSAGYMAEQKMEFHSDGEKDLGPIVASLSLGSPAIMKFRPVPSKWMSDDGQLKEGRKTPPVVIELTLRHGDTLVMEGAEIQEYYQHAVHPCGFRIAATARRVDIT